MKELNFYNIFERVQGMMRKMGQDEVFLTIPDKQPEAFKFQEVQESLQRLKDEGHTIKVERMDSKSNHGFFGNVVWISTEPVVEE
jgi:hypothetical protein